METEMLTGALSAAVDEASFDLECTAIASDGRPRQPSRQRASAAQLQEVYLREKDRLVELYARANVPDAVMTRLVDALRRTLGQFIHPDTDRIGHAFPVDGSVHGVRTFRQDGLLDKESQSPLREFAYALVRAAAIMGVKEAAGLLAGWSHGQPVNVRMCTVLSGLPLAVPLTPRQDIRIVPLALSTAELPRLPTRRDAAPRDYLGLSLLTVQLSASPALFRPDPDAKEGRVHSSSVDGVNFDLVCEALSLQVNEHVSTGFIWHEYPDAAPFWLSAIETWGSGGDNRLKSRDKVSSSHDMLTGTVTITPSKDAPPPLCLDEEEILRIVEALRCADRKLRIAVNRWRRSKRSGVRLEESYIDLRIALEALYLKDFDDNRSQEMRLRLSLFGAWHLAETLEERRSICKNLRAAYDKASRIVHGGEVSKGGASDYWKERAELAQAQDLCCRGILKLLREGPPKDWSDLVLGGPGS